MNERDLLQKLYNFIVTKQIVQGEVDSLKDMAKRYMNPPISMAFPVVLRMTVQDSYTLNDILSATETLLVSSEVTPLATPKVTLPEEAPHEP